MEIPRWFALIVAATVFGFGFYRVWLSRRSDEDDERARERGGLFAMPRRRHLVFGAVYMVMGVLLLASAFGVRLNPF
jgi:hypothetical protein